MAKLYIIGNGFDLAHNLPTKYEDFFYWFWEHRFKEIYKENSNTSEDVLCSLRTRRYASWYQLMFHLHLQLSSMNGRQLYPWLCDENMFAIGYCTFLDNLQLNLGDNGVGH